MINDNIVAYKSSYVLNLMRLIIYTLLGIYWFKGIMMVLNMKDNSEKTYFGLAIFLLIIMVIIMILLIIGIILSLVRLIQILIKPTILISCDANGFILNHPKHEDVKINYDEIKSIYFKNYRTFFRVYTTGILYIKTETKVYKIRHVAEIDNAGFRTRDIWLKVMTLKREKKID